MARQKPTSGAPTPAIHDRAFGADADADRALAERDPSPQLTSAQTRFLRGQAHGLKAMLQVGGKGITDALVAEIELALEHHELIKIKVAAEDREARDGMIDAIVDRTGAALVQRIGHTAVLYRQSRDKRQIVLPRA
ncbi:ribosome assembly RNA-binding protein YhbY [Lysobacter alkalisoli]|uniref:Ribosome assembly RNA-binding protein YhbY n=1 Tax=Marilutibacter alkalisoli TaxID=2591633 RepID=A0A514BQD1_9GAMM|nr:ribosome assembly RNA-binding protein YhbY [Lysobacter alkalisoli]